VTSNTLFTDVITTVCEKVANSIGFVYGPCLCVQYTALYMVVYMVVYTCTRPVHGCGNGPCTQPSTDRVHGGRVQGRPYTAVDRVHAPYTAVTRPCTCREHGSYTRPCTRPIHNRVHGL